MWSGTASRRGARLLRAGHRGRRDQPLQLRTPPARCGRGDRADWPAQHREFVGASALLLEWGVVSPSQLAPGAGGSAGWRGGSTRRPGLDRSGLRRLRLVLREGPPGHRGAVAALPWPPLWSSSSAQPLAGETRRRLPGYDRCSRAPRRLVLPPPEMARRRTGQLSLEGRSQPGSARRAWRRRASPAASRCWPTCRAR